MKEQGKKVTLALIAILLGFVYYYLEIDVPINNLVGLIIVSFLASSVVYLLIEKITSSKGGIFVLVVINLIMLIDILYFRYFNGLPSVRSLGMMGELTEAKESIPHLFRLSDLLLVTLLCFPFLEKYLPSKQCLDHKEEPTSVPLWQKAYLILVLLGAAVVLSPLTTIESQQLKTMEFFTYHIGDLIYGLAKEESAESGESILSGLLEEKKTYVETPYGGIGKGKNLIVIQVESLQDFVINRDYEGQAITPHLNQLVSEGVYFNRYYQQLGKGNTSDAEFASLNSLYPVLFGQAYTQFKDNTFYGLGAMLKDQRYRTAYFHGNDGSFYSRRDIYKNQGFEDFYELKDYQYAQEQLSSFGLDDESFMIQSLDKIKDYQEPFFTFLITLTSHHPYDIKEEMKELQLSKKDEGTLFGNYLQAVHYTDKAIGLFIEGLKKEGLYDNSVIAIYGDHYGLNCKNTAVSPRMKEFLGYAYDFDEMMNIPLIIRSHGMEPRILERVGGQVDFLPTIAHVMGMEEGLTPYVLGDNLFNDEKGLVPQQSYMLKGSFISDDLVFEMSRDGIFKNGRAWNPNTHEPADVDQCYKLYEKSIEKIDQGLAVLQQDPLSGGEIAKEQTKPPKYISHAGGRVEGLSYTNSLESIDHSYDQGLKFIELDFIWTEDDQPVIFHDWNNLDLLNAEPGIKTLAQYEKLEMVEGLHQLTLAQLVEWLRQRPDAYIITDVKSDNQKLLLYIMKNYEDVANQFIPQIYQFGEYVPIRYMGYEKIILSLYANSNSEEEVIEFVKRNPLFALTMHIDRIQGGWAKRIREKTGIFIYGHTINDPDLEKEILSKGADGIYTDDLGF